jgi:hypothetical protein
MKRKDVIWYEGLYRVNNFGDVRNRKGKILKPHKTIRWYMRYQLYNKWITKHKRWHRLIAEAFIPNPENKPFINHKNWIRNDNRLENLEWCTNSENMRHWYRILWNKPTWLWRFWKDHNKSKRIWQYMLGWEFIRTRDSIADIQRELWFNHSSISKCCRNLKKKTKWYIRRFLD